MSAAGRARDAVAVALLACGAGMYLFALRGMRVIAEGGGARASLVPEGQRLVLDGALAQWAGYHRLSRAGIGIALAGVAVGIWSALRHARTPHPPAP